MGCRQSDNFLNGSDDGKCFTEIGRKACRVMIFILTRHCALSKHLLTTRKRDLLDYN